MRHRLRRPWPERAKPVAVAPRRSVLNFFSLLRHKRRSHVSARFSPPRPEASRHGFRAGRPFPSGGRMKDRRVRLGSASLLV